MHTENVYALIAKQLYSLKGCLLSCKIASANGQITYIEVCVRYVFLSLDVIPQVVNGLSVMASQLELEHEQLFDGVFALIKDYLLKYQDRSSKVNINHPYIITNSKTSVCT